METVCVKIKLKKGSLAQVRIWFQTLCQRPEEVLESLKNEEVFVESVFLDRQGEDDYLVYYMRAACLSNAREVAMKSKLAIDKYHKECLRQFCEERQELELLLDYCRI